MTPQLPLAGPPGGDRASTKGATGANSAGSATGASPVAPRSPCITKVSRDSSFEGASR